MKYNGQELQPITTPQIFDPPKELLVWDDGDAIPHIESVWGIAPKSANIHYPVYCITVERFKHCAEIPQQKPKRATYLQLAEWLAKGNGMWKLRNDNIVNLNIKFDEEEFEEEVEGYILIRPFGTTEWVEPTLENMGMEVKDD